MACPRTSGSLQLLRDATPKGVPRPLMVFRNPPTIRIDKFRTIPARVGSFLVGFDCLQVVCLPVQLPDGLTALGSCCGSVAQLGILRSTALIGCSFGFEHCSHNRWRPSSQVLSWVAGSLAVARSCSRLGFCIVAHALQHRLPARLRRDATLRLHLLHEASNQGALT